MAKKRKPRYDDKFRASAVVMLEAAGYPERRGALTQVARHLGMHRETLRRWHTAQRNPPPREVVTEKAGDLAALLRQEAEAIFGEMDDARQDAQYRDLAVALGIVIDKLQLLEGKPTERREYIDERARAERIARILDRGRARRAGHVTGGRAPHVSGVREASHTTD